MSSAALAGLALCGAISIGLAAPPIPRRPRGSARGGVLGHRRRRREQARNRAGALLAADLLAACLAAGAGPLEAVEATARVLDGPVAQRLAEAARSVRAGGSVESCWQRLDQLPELAAVGQILARVAVSGVRAAAAMSAEANRLRSRRRADADRALARLGVWAVAPLGLCFLPAFVCLGIVPVAIGLARGLAG